MNSDYIIARNEYICAGIIYGTIGCILHFVNIPSEFVVICRGIIGALFIYTYLMIKKNHMDFPSIKSNLFNLILSGAGLGLNWVFLFAAYRYTSVAIGTLCNYVGPIIVIALSPFLYKERLTLKKVLCVLSAAIGIICISGVFDSTDTHVSLFGIALGLLSAVCFVINVVFTRRTKDVSVYDKAVTQLVAAALASLPYALIVNRNTQITIDLRSVILILVLGLIHTGLAYCFYFRAMSTLPVQTFSILGYIEPVVAIILSALFLKEKLTIMGIIGAVLILGAVFVSELKTK